MIEPTLVIVNILSNRIRFKLSYSLKNVEEAVRMLQGKKGINNVRYNFRIRSLLIEFDDLIISPEEVVMSTAVVYSSQYGMKPIKLMGNTPTRMDMPVLAKYSIMAITTAFISRIFVANKRIQEILNWVAVSTTIGATIEHAYSELNTKGAFDPEVVSVMYLMNSVRSGGFIQPSIITWFTTFGRHIINPSYDKAIIKINKFDDLSEGEIYYNISVRQQENISKKVNFIREFISKSIEQENDYGNNLLFLTDKTIGPYKNRFCGNRKGYNKISFS